jgi:hypothetical protein
MEQRYRRALLWYPRKWQRENADVVVSTLLDMADGAGRSAPRRSELLHLAMSGVAFRVGVFLSSAARDGISTIALGSGAMFAVAFFVVHTWSPWSPPDLRSGPNFQGFGPFVNAGLIIYALWVGAFLFGLVGMQRAVRGVMIVAVVAPTVLGLLNRLQSDIRFGPTSTTLAFFTLLALLVLVGTPRDVQRLSLVALATTVALLAVEVRIGVPASAFLDDRYFWHEAGSLFNVTSLVVIGLFVAIALGIARRGTWAQIVLGSLIPWAGVWCAAAIRVSYWDAFGFLCLLLATAAVSAAGVLAIRRSRETVPRDDWADQ